jgi:hypothetical protein
MTGLSDASMQVDIARRYSRKVGSRDETMSRDARQVRCQELAETKLVFGIDD